MKNECTRKVWITVINLKEGTFRKNVYFCSDHFEEACFNKSMKAGNYRHYYFTHHVPRNEKTLHRCCH